uniref:CCHC-type domain-containing protein n=1 Tax=Pundamilia nyererei TaxID=303518 RepID=A0A3B4GDS6_9CICH
MQAKTSPPLPPELLIQPGSNDVSSSLKRQINTSTESSTGEVDLDGTSHPTPSPVPQFEEQVSKVTQETTQITKVRDKVGKVTSAVWLVSKKKKKKNGRVLLVDVERCGVKFRIINVYGYTDKKERTALFQTFRIVIQKELGFSPMQIDYIFGLPGKKSYEVIFATSTFYESCLDKFNRLRQTRPQLENIKMTPLSGREPKAVTVIMHSEYVRVEDIKTWLSFKCMVKRGLDLNDEDGIRTGAYRFYIHLHRGETSGDLIHLPPTIQLGAIRGYVFYPGQPKTCRKCGVNDHLATECENVVCKNCKSEEHTTSDCPFPRKCNLCGGEGHTFRACAQSYANKVKRPHQQSWRIFGHLF